MFFIPSRRTLALAMVVVVLGICLATFTQSQIAATTPHSVQPALSLESVASDMQASALMPANQTSSYMQDVRSDSGNTAHLYQRLNAQMTDVGIMTLLVIGALFIGVISLVIYWLALRGGQWFGDPDRQ